MKVILLEKVPHLGDFGDEVSVKPGFGRNYLVPQGKAVTATAANRENFSQQRTELEAAALQQVAAAKDRAEKMQDLSITLKARASEEKKLYGSVAAAEVVAALKEVGIVVTKKEVRLTAGPIHFLGEYEVILALHSAVMVPITAIVVASD
ncbi:MAG: 50S ribosomal protein L9 [Legionellales bacterium]|nr:MAG: 50S ribosomal protein L9 [Legionellales bacterium]